VHVREGGREGGKKVVRQRERERGMGYDGNLIWWTNSWLLERDLFGWTGVFCESMGTVMGGRSHV
jgi:hypothetical protein